MLRTPPPAWELSSLTGLIFVVIFGNITNKKETPFNDVSDCFMWTMSVVRSLLTVVLFREANSSCLSDDSDLDLTWVSHFCLDLFREVE